jgi:hypothetical protein
MRRAVASTSSIDFPNAVNLQCTAVVAKQSVVAVDMLSDQSELVQCIGAALPGARTALK